MNKKFFSTTLLTALLATQSPLSIAQTLIDPAEVGLPAVGGYPEYVFIEKIEKSKARDTAYLLTQALGRGRLIIFSYMPKLTDPTLGDKGFTPDYFVQQWRASLADIMLDLTAQQQRIMTVLFEAGRQSIANNQTRLNLKGVKWKHYLPASWARETATVMQARTGIVSKQPAVHYRHPANAPDAREKEVLVQFTRQDYNGESFGEYSAMGKQAVYRYFEPIRLMPPCLACHGKPKGEKDMLGFAKDGLANNDVIGLFSITLGIQE